MSIKYRSRIFRKPLHWSEDRYNEFLKVNGYFRNRRELNYAKDKQKGSDGGKE